ncbi:MAG: 30S ribosomal protein S12 methylthiotransferase RimO [Clostridiales bacterium]|nr:30S ribosomal protein S12 methylthiotransferase RimO [Clostridiales bacterium]
MTHKIGMISLGCAKNQVNSENMLAALDQAGFEIISGPDGADAVIINTCGFIESARSEAYYVIGEVKKLKVENKVGKIIVAGCLPERYKSLLDDIPEIDAVLGCGSYHRIVGVVRGVLSGRKAAVFDDPDTAPIDGSRILSTPGYTAYIKIAEGCDNRCSYCVIPSLRGRYRSRRMEDILEEAKGLAGLGVRELIVIAQDTSRYGIDLYGKRRLGELLERLCRIDGLRWIRVHYLYPDEIDEGLIRVFADEEKIVKYLDIPIQHASDRILKAMNRRGDGKYLDNLFARLRDKIPGAVFRTSVIVGFPGETREDFEELCAFLKKHKFVRGGVFKYSAEKGSPAERMDGQVDEDEKERRYELACALQSRIIDEYNRSLISGKLTVLCEGFDSDIGYYFGRTFADSPEVDARIYFRAPFDVSPGMLLAVMAVREADGELYGEAVDITEV